MRGNFRVVSVKLFHCYAKNKRDSLLSYLMKKVSGRFWRRMGKSLSHWDVILSTNKWTQKYWKHILREHTFGKQAHSLNL